MSKRALATVLGLLIVALLAGACGGGGEEPTATPRPAPTDTSPPTDTPPPTPIYRTFFGDVPTAAAGDGPGEVAQVIHKENPYRFEPDNFDWQVGKTITLEFAVPTEFHTFNVDGLGIEIFINAGESVQQDVTPSTAGTFKLYCVPHETLGMVGEVRVS